MLKSEAELLLSAVGEYCTGAYHAKKVTKLRAPLILIIKIQERYF